MRVLITCLVASLFAVGTPGLAAQSATTTTGAPGGTGASSVEFDLNTAAGGVTKVEVETEDGWEDISDDVCVETAAGSRPTVKKKSGKFPEGKKIRIHTENWCENEGEDWGNETCPSPPI